MSENAYGGWMGDWRVPVCPIHGARHITIDHNLGAMRCHAPRCRRLPVYAQVVKPGGDSDQRVEKLEAAIREHRDSPYVPGLPETVDPALLHLEQRDAKLYSTLRGDSDE